MKAFVFPGQGSQVVGMGKALHDGAEVCRRTFEEADDALGMKLSALCFAGPEAELQLTAVAQPAIVTVSIAAHRLLADAGVAPDVVAGHSLGEYAALVAAGGLGFADAVRLVRRRGQYMQEAVPVGQGAMAALMGLDADQVAEICRTAAAAAAAAGNGNVVCPANLNAPGQIVISGHAAAVDRALALASERGARRAIKLAVSAPFHCPLMQPAADRLALDLEKTTFNDLAVPLVANVSASPVRSGADARAGLRAQVTAPVRWEESVRKLASMGVTRALEVGPGKVLSGLIKRIDASISCAAAGDPEGVTAAKESLA